MTDKNSQESEWTQELEEAKKEETGKEQTTEEHDEETAPSPDEESSDVEEKTEEPEAPSEETPEESETPAEPSESEAPKEESAEEAPQDHQEEDEYEALLKESAKPSEDFQEEQETVGPAAVVEEDEPEEAQEEKEEVTQDTRIFALRTTANREDQVLAFVSANAAQKKLPVYSVIGPHGMRGYIFVEAADRISAEQAATGVPYSKGLLPSEVQYSEIEHMLEQVKKEINIQKNDIVEIISGPFKREQAKISRVDKTKEEVVVELLEAAVPIPITLKTDDVKVIRREDE